MKWYCYNEYDPDHPEADETGGYIVTISEDEIKRTYWPYWYERMSRSLVRLKSMPSIVLKNVWKIG